MINAEWSPGVWNVLGTGILWSISICVVLLLVFIGFVIYPFKEDSDD